MKTVLSISKLIFFTFLLSSSSLSVSQVILGHVLDYKTIAEENKLEGTFSWKLSNPAVHQEIEGYASLTSVAIGDSIELFVNTSALKFTYEIYRMGWYNGLGGRLVFKSKLIDGTKQQIPKPDKDTGLIECNWKNPVHVIIGNDWTTGVYLVKLEEKDTQKQSYILFVVRNDDSYSDIIFQLAVTTYQAYNYWGGKSLYNWGSGDSLPYGSSAGTAAVKISFDRPYALNTNMQVANTVGSGEFFANFQPVSRGYPISSAGWDYNMIRWLEMKGYNVSYSTNVDTHTSFNKLQQHKVFLSNGHDEYWSKQMRDHIIQARNTGVNLAFFGANAMYWQVRFESNTTQSKENRVLVCYKNANSDSQKGINSTVMFREEPINNSESKLLGVQFFAEPIDGDLVVINENHKLFEETNLKNGDRINGILGYEVDGVTKYSPQNIEILTSSKAIYKNPKTLKKKIKVAILKTPMYLIVLLSLISFLIVFYFLKWLYSKNWIKSNLIVSIVLFGVFVVGIFGMYKFYDFNQKHYSHMTIYTAKNGAKVFATGSIQWSWGLDDYGAPELRTSRKNENVEIITKNVLKMFEVEPSTE